MSKNKQPIKNFDVNNAYKEAVNYVNKTYVEDSSGHPAMLLGDVAELIKIATGKSVDLSTLPPKIDTCIVDLSILAPKTKTSVPTPQEGIVKCTLEIIKAGKPISEELKIQFRNCLDWLIKTEKNKEKLAWLFNLRGMIYAGNYPDLTS